MSRIPLAMRLGVRATLVLVTLVLVGVSGMAPADAIIRRRTITPEVDTGLPIRTQGRQVSMTGPMACDPGETWEVRANLTQGRIRGEGRSEGVCRGDIQEWVVRVAAQGDAAFEPGDARGCAVLRTLKDGAQTDSHEWCNEIRLIGASDDGDGGTGAISWVALGVGAVAVVVALAALLRRPAR
jgi:hypothetical protein